MKKVIKSIITLGMAFCLTGCSFAGFGLSATAKSVLDALRDEGFVKYSSKSDVKKTGAYQIISRSNDIDAVIDEYDDDSAFDIPMPDSSDVRFMLHARKSQNPEGVIVLYFEFKDEDDAEDYFDDMTDYYNDSVDIIEEAVIFDFDNEMEYGFDDSKDTLCFAAILPDGSDRKEVAFECILIDDAVCIFYSVDDENGDYIEICDNLADSAGFDEPTSVL